MLEHLDHLAETAAQAISNIKFDKVVVWDGGTAPTARQRDRRASSQSLAGTLPPMLQIMKDIGGVEMPEYFGQARADDGKDGSGSGGSAAGGSGAKSGANGNGHPPESPPADKPPKGGGKG